MNGEAAAGEAVAGEAADSEAAPAGASLVFSLCGATIHEETEDKYESKHNLDR